MRRNFLVMGRAALLAVAGMGLMACNDDDNPGWNSNSPRITFENKSPEWELVQSGVFNALNEGESSSFTFAAAPGQALALATGVVATNDLFIAPANPGIALYDNEGNPLTGTLTAPLKLWDNGTRSNGAEATPTADKGVTEVVGSDAEGNNYPAASELLEVSLSYDATTSMFTCTLTNISAETTLPTTLSAGVYAVSNVLNGKLLDPTPIFERGEEASDELTALAEAGNNELLWQELKEDTGIMTTLNGAIVVIYTGDKNPIYELNEPDAGLGLALFAQTGNPEALETALGELSHVKRIYSTKSVVQPGGKIECLYRAREDEKIAYALAFGYSNDWFFTNGPEIKAHQEGSITGRTLLLDSGTAVSQYPGAGAAQFLFGGEPIPEELPVGPVSEEFPLPSVNQLIQVTMR